MQGTIDIPGVPEGYVAVWHNELAEGTLYWNDLNQIGQDSGESVRGRITSGQRRVVFVKAVPPRQGWHIKPEIGNGEIVWYEDGEEIARVLIEPAGNSRRGFGHDARKALVAALSGLPRVEG